MSKFLIVLVFVATTFSIALAQPGQNPNDPPSKGMAPKTENGIGRADVRVFDENGNPIRNAYVKLESVRSDGYFCESWGDTDEAGNLVMLPIHMGALKFTVKAKGYQKRTFALPARDLSEPVRVTMHKK
jgi:hypothetical protein